jgi:nucleoside 2-deoxyribosyltransferase
MKVFIICSVRQATDEIRQYLEDYTEFLEGFGMEVHLPHRDTDQTASVLEICTQNRTAIKAADEVHIIFNPDSFGSHFDLGMAFALGKKIRVIDNIEYGEGKSFARMIDEWEDLQNGWNDTTDENSQSIP